MSDGDPILEARSLAVRYPDQRGPLGGVRSWRRAVDDVSFVVPRGQTLALVGESGCGKSSTGRAILGLQPQASGELLFRPAGADGGRDLLKLPPSGWKAVRRRIALVFQDSGSALNPRLKVWQSVAEPLQIHRLASGAGLRRRVDELLERVGLDPASGERYPDQFSGGQRQRIGIARALGTEPELVVCDEIVSALDVLVQRQVLELLSGLQRERGLSYLFICHDLAVVSGFAQRTAVMKGGRLVEQGPTAEMFSAPKQEYTRCLLDAVPLI
ncbi:MAG: ABC transporter ATP-binding protein [Planctomycetes bacterium]|nr:ABC transporter ATP-binding protein [Planctomycetota bacterium]